MGIDLLGRVLALPVATGHGDKHILRGSDLAMGRKIRGLSARQVAEAMSVSRQRICGIEALAQVPAGLAARYERALGEAVQRRVEDLWARA